ncbi:MarC family protein [Aliamphritea spongicola]|uniref:MarC family protein n=1 Tax=Aliamphritea spongicola TaxID=707589 RepID=UPI00196AB25A|nr:MarC family protein [Aliamphritea spongicola]MBN3561659.1 MarC family protein [Aliamphritea spongicola]
MDILVYLNAITALFIIIDPIGAAIVFHSLVPAGETGHRVKMAVKSIVISTLLLIIFGNYGEPFLNKLGINIEALRISGGLLLFYTAFKMITQDVEYTVTTAKRDISVFPMSIPLMAGPGSLTLSILLFSQAENAEQNLSILLAIISITVLTLVLMLLSRYVKVIIGRTGDEILRRFLGVILAALAIQFVYDGVTQLIASS